MNSSSWIQIIGYVIAILGAGFGSYVAVRTAIGRIEAGIDGLKHLIGAEVKRIEELLQIEVRRLDQLIETGQQDRKEHHHRLRYLEQRLMDGVANHNQ